MLAVYQRHSAIVIFLLSWSVLQDFSMQPPAQELQARDIHDNVWTFRHIFRGGENIALSLLQNGSSRTLLVFMQVFPHEVSCI